MRQMMAKSSSRNSDVDRALRVLASLAAASNGRHVAHALSHFAVLVTSRA
jgi:hypothetical protein